MRKLIILLLAVLPLNLTFAQKQASMNAAAEISKDYLLRNYGTTKIDTIFFKVGLTGDTLLYEVVFDNDKYLLVSGSYSCPPFLLSGKKSNQKSIFECNDVPPFGSLVNMFSNYVQNQFNDDSTYPGKNDKWNPNVANESSLRKNQSSIGPFLTSNWKEDVSNDSLDLEAYNYHIDECDNCGQRCKVGNGAVAMAQIMNYWKYPVYICDTEQIDWCNMADKLLVGMNGYHQSRDAISKFLRYSADLIETSYGCYFSSSDPQKIRNALQSLGYGNCELRKMLIRSPEWINRIRDSIFHGRPIIYYVSSGIIENTFVIDGYDGENDMFYVKFKYYNEEVDKMILNGFLADGNCENKAIFNIRPNQSSYPSYEDFEIPLWQHYHLYYANGSNYDVEPWENVPTTFRNLMSVPSDNEFPDTWMTIPSGASAVYEAHNSVVLVPGFHAVTGSKFNAKITPCPCHDIWPTELLVPESEEMPIIEHSNNETSFASMPSSLIDEQTANIFPNPAHETVSINVNDIDRIYLYDINGKSMFRWYVSSKTNHQIVLNVKDIPSGMYLVRTISKDGSVGNYRFAKN